ncbi:uncharacterized protein LOC126985288 isoform X2 [Eriocheir sinensis]|uniref:uncharacterized protein LOC126985288 isoform X2 n=1 Tax=Eriocheir sinensis TaxID=95602 RepID=UPI0021C74FF2|nr:uncharacterized protein LOC126985288 isoform X2 [Eriocheir sinensis]
MGIDAMLRSSTPHKSQDLANEGAAAEVDVRGGGLGMGAGGQQGGTGRRLPDPLEVSSVTYLSVPETPDSRRPSTADLVIEKLQVEKVEGGGLSIQGVALASNCHVTLIVFGVFFMLAGVVLSYVSYSVPLGAGEEGPEGKEKAAEPEDHLASVAQMRMIGPAFLIVGFLMVGLGITLFILARKISRDEKAKQLVISEQQLCELESSFSYTAPSPLHTAYPAPHQQYPILAVRRNSWWIDSVQRDGATTGEAQDSAIQCPSPIEESREGSPKRILTPVPLEKLPDLAEPPAADIACFPPSTSHSGLSPDVQTPPPVPEEAEASGFYNTSDREGSPTEVRNDIPVLSTAAQELQRRAMAGSEYGYATPPRLIAEGQDMRSAAMFKPSSAAQSRSHGVPVPSSAGLIPSIQVTVATPVLPPLPRLSRHHATRPDSRPTTADSR